MDARLIKAQTLPVGSPERRRLLQALQKKKFGPLMVSEGDVHFSVEGDAEGMVTLTVAGKEFELTSEKFDLLSKGVIEALQSARKNVGLK